jgi:hypothetical protein
MAMWCKNRAVSQPKQKCLARGLAPGRDMATGMDTRIPSKTVIQSLSCVEMTSWSSGQRACMYAQVGSSRHRRSLTWCHAVS